MKILTINNHDHPYNVNPRPSISVHEDGGCASRDLPIYTIGISKCSVCILKNLDTGDALLLHLSGNSLIYIAPMLMRKYVEPFLEMPGNKSGVMIYGDMSAGRPNIEDWLERNQVSLLPKLKVPSGGHHFDVVFYPEKADVHFMGAFTSIVYQFEELETLPQGTSERTLSKSLAEIIEEKELASIEARKFDSKCFANYKTFQLLMKRLSPVEASQFAIENLNYIKPRDFYNVIMFGLDNKRYSDIELRALTEATLAFGEKYSHIASLICSYIGVVEQVIHRDSLEETDLKFLEFLIDNSEKMITYIKSSDDSKKLSNDLHEAIETLVTQHRNQSFGIS